MQGIAREWALRRQEAEPNGENATLEELRVAMEAAPNRRSYVRLAVIRSLLMGLERGVVAQQFCRSDRVVRLWIEMFNTGGIDADYQRASGAKTPGEAGTLTRSLSAGLRKSFSSLARASSTDQNNST